MTGEMSSALLLPLCVCHGMPARLQRSRLNRTGRRALRQHQAVHVACHCGRADQELNLYLFEGIPRAGSYAALLRPIDVGLRGGRRAPTCQLHRAQRARKEPVGDGRLVAELEGLQGLTNASWPTISQVD